MFMALMREMNRAGGILMEQQRVCDANHIIPVRSLNETFQSVLVKDISDVCVCVKIKNNLRFVSVVPKLKKKTTAETICER